MYTKVYVTLYGVKYGRIHIKPLVKIGMDRTEQGQIQCERSVHDKDV